MKKLVLILCIIFLPSVVFAADTIRFKAAPNQPSMISTPQDIDKQIEVVTQVDRTDTFSIRQVQNDIANCDIQIASLQQRKIDLQAKIDACVSALSIDIKTDVKQTEGIFHV